MSCRLVVSVAPRPAVTGIFDVRNLPEEIRSFSNDVLVLTRDEQKTGQERRVIFGGRNIQIISDVLTMGFISRHSMANQARLNKLLLKTLPLFCPTLAELLSNLKALQSRDVQIFVIQETSPLLLKSCLVNLSLGFKTKCQDPIFLPEDPEDFRRPNDPVMEGLRPTDLIR